MTNFASTLRERLSDRFNTFKLYSTAELEVFCPFRTNEVELFVDSTEQKSRKQIGYETEVQYEYVAW